MEVRTYWLVLVLGLAKHSIAGSALSPDQPCSHIDTINNYYYYDGDGSQGQWLDSKGLGYKSGQYNQYGLPQTENGGIIKGGTAYGNKGPYGSSWSGQSVDGRNNGPDGIRGGQAFNIRTPNGGQPDANGQWIQNGRDGPYGSSGVTRVSGGVPFGGFNDYNPARGGRINYGTDYDLNGNPRGPQRNNRNQYQPNDGSRGSTTDWRQTGGIDGIPAGGYGIGGRWPDTRYSGYGDNNPRIGGNIGGGYDGQIAPNHWQNGQYGNSPNSYSGSTRLGEGGHGVRRWESTDVTGYGNEGKFPSGSSSSNGISGNLYPDTYTGGERGSGLNIRAGGSGVAPNGGYQYGPVTFPLDNTRYAGNVQTGINGERLAPAGGFNENLSSETSITGNNPAIISQQTTQTASVSNPGIGSSTNNRWNSPSIDSTGGTSTSSVTSTNVIRSGGGAGGGSAYWNGDSTTPYSPDGAYYSESRGGHQQSECEQLARQLKEKCPHRD